MTDLMHRVKWLFAGILLIAVLLCATKDLLLQRAAPVWDAIDFYAPVFSLVADHAKAHRLLLWDPWIDGGLPDFADGQGLANSPILLLFALVTKNPFHGFLVYWISMWIFGGIGMLLLCRHLKAPEWGGLVIALGFMACGFYTGHGEHTSYIYSISFVPWILWRFDVSLVRRTYWGSAQAGLLWGLSALGGYPALTFLDLMLLGAWTVGHLCFRRDDIRTDAAKVPSPKPVFAVLSLVLLGIVGLAILSPAYYSFFRETRGYTYRTNGIDRHWAITSNDLPPQALTTLSSPNLYLLNFPPYRIWPETDVSTCNIYLGVLPVIFAILALLKRSYWRIWLALVGAFFLCCSVGDHLPIRGWVYDYVPPTRYFRHPSIFAAYTLIVLCILAAYAAKDMEESWSSSAGSVRRSFFLIALLAISTAWFCYLHVLHRAGLTICAAQYPSLHVGITWLSAVLISLLAWRSAFDRRFLCCSLVVLAIFDASSTLYISQGTLFSPYTVPWWRTMMGRHKPNLDLTSSGLQRSLHPSEDLGTYPNDRNLAPKEAVFFNNSPLVNRYFESFAFDPKLSEFVTGPNRIWFSGSAVWIPPSQEAFAEFSDVAKRLNAPVLLLHTREQMLSAAATGGAGSDWVSQAQAMVRAEVHLTSYQPNIMSFQYHAEGDGWLLVTDRWAPSWTASVNGKACEVLAADFIFRAVPVARGNNTVMFRYQPRVYLPLVVLSWTSISLFFILEICRTVGLRLYTRTWPFVQYH